MRVLFLILLLFSSNCFAGVVIKFGDDKEIPGKKAITIINNQSIPLEVFYKLKNVRSVEIIDANYHLCKNIAMTIAKFNVDPKLKEGFVKLWLKIPCVNRTKKNVFFKIRIIRDTQLTADQIKDYNFIIPIRFQSFYDETNSDPGIQ